MIIEQYKYPISVICITKTESCPFAVGLHRTGPPPEGRRVRNVWPAGGHLGRAADEPHPLVHVGRRQLQRRPLQPRGGETSLERHTPPTGIPPTVTAPAPRPVLSRPVLTPVEVVI